MEWRGRWQRDPHERFRAGRPEQAEASESADQEGTADDRLVRDPSAPLPQPASAAAQAADAGRDTGLLVDSEHVRATEGDPAAVTPGPPLNRRAPFLIALLATLGVGAGYGILMMLIQLSAVITYIVVAMFIALGLDPIVLRLIRLGLNRALAVLIAMLGVLVVCALLGWLIVPTIVDQITQLIQNTPGYLDDLQASRWVQDLNQRWHISDRVVRDLQKNINQRTVASLFGGVLGVGRAFADGVVAVFSVLVLMLYFLVAMPRVKAAVYKTVPQSRRARVVYLSEEISRRVGGYILGQLGVAVINGLFAYVILIALGLPFPAVLAAVVALLALVPIVGTLVGGVIMTLVALASGWVAAVIVLGYYVAYHLFETYVLSPRIMRRAVEVPPVITIIAVLSGAALLGILGALLAIPVAAGLLLIYNQVLVPRQQRN